MITIDATASHNHGTSDTWSHTVGSGSNRLLLVAVATHWNGGKASAVTYNGASLTKLFELTGNTEFGTPYRRTQLWYLVAPDVGAHDVVVTYQSGDYSPHYASISFFNVDQLSPFRNAGTYGISDYAAAASVDVTDCIADDLCVAFISYMFSETSTITDNAGQTRQIESSSTGPASVLSTKTAAGSTTNIGWTWINSAYVLAAGVALAPVEPISPPAADMPLTSHAPGYNVYSIPAADMPLAAQAPQHGIVIDIPAADMVMTAVVPGFGPTPVPVPVAAMPLLSRAPANIWNLPASVRPASQIIFYLILTGADDGLDDVYLPMSSFQARMRDGEPSYISCVIPDSLTYEADITSRSNGDIIIQKGYKLVDGTVYMEEIARVDFESIQIDRGARNDSATISGHRTVSSTAPKERAVSGVSFYGMKTDGKRRIRAEMDLFLRCGDTCIYGSGGNDYFTVGSITYYVSAKPPALYMEVMEA